MRLILFLIFTLTAQSMLAAAASTQVNILAVGQGISSPTSTSTVNFSTGYTSENPLGTIYQNGSRVSFEHAKSDTSSGSGAELGYGQGDWGLAAGYFKNDCSGCQGNSSAAVGINIYEIGVGLRLTEDIYGAGFVFNPHGTHRVGLMAENNRSGGTGLSLNSYGLGYSYVASAYTLTLDASSRTFEDSTVNDKRIQVTPGVVLRASILQLSINDRITLNKDKNNPLHDDEDHDLWFGLGLGGDRWHLALYSDYVSDFAASASLFF